MNWINCAVKLYSWPLSFHKVVWQQTWGEVLVLIPSSSTDTDPFWINSEKIMKIGPCLLKYRENKVAHFFETWCSGKMYLI